MLQEFCHMKWKYGVCHLPNLPIITLKNMREQGDVLITIFGILWITLS